MTCEEAKREMMFAKRNVIADSWIDQAYDKAIEALSQPVREKGEWIPSENGMFVHCSKCGCHWESGIVKNCNMEFCPSCGSFNGSGEHVRESD